MGCYNLYHVFGEVGKSYFSAVQLSEFILYKIINSFQNSVDASLYVNIYESISLSKIAFQRKSSFSTCF